MIFRFFLPSYSLLYFMFYMGREITVCICMEKEKEKEKEKKISRVSLCWGG